MPVLQLLHADTLFFMHSGVPKGDSETQVFEALLSTRYV